MNYRFRSHASFLAAVSALCLAALAVPAAHAQTTGAILEQSPREVAAKFGRPSEERDATPRARESLFEDVHHDGYSVLVGFLEGRAVEARIFRADGKPIPLDVIPVLLTPRDGVPWRADMEQFWRAGDWSAHLINGQLDVRTPQTPELRRIVAASSVWQGGLGLTDLSPDEAAQRSQAVARAIGALPADSPSRAVLESLQFVIERRGALREAYRKGMADAEAVRLFDLSDDAAGSADDLNTRITQADRLTGQVSAYLLFQGSLQAVLRNELTKRHVPEATIRDTIRENVTTTDVLDDIPLLRIEERQMNLLLQLLTFLKTHPHTAAAGAQVTFPEEKQQTEYDGMVRQYDLLARKRAELKAELAR